MEDGGPDGCRFVVEEGKLEDRAVLAQLGSVGRIMAQARAKFRVHARLPATPCTEKGFWHGWGSGTADSSGPGGIEDKVKSTWLWPCNEVETTSFVLLCDPIVHML